MTRNPANWFYASVTVIFVLLTGSVPLSCTSASATADNSPPNDALSSDTMDPSSTNSGAASKPAECTCTCPQWVVTNEHGVVLGPLVAMNGKGPVFLDVASNSEIPLRWSGCLGALVYLGFPNADCSGDVVVEVASYADNSDFIAVYHDITGQWYTPSNEDATIVVKSVLAPGWNDSGCIPTCVEIEYEPAFDYLINIQTTALRWKPDSRYTIGVTPGSITVRWAAQ
ncbi:MAG: hypothetical protein HUU55_08645 [Myxococcales bacterium]|nr:hypothetical protein [Myxococcales bacterium]